MRQLLPLDRLNREMSNNRNVFQEIYSLNQPVIYSYLCNAVGRVLCDLFVYRSRYRAEDGEYIIEVDASIATALKRLLLGYNLSRNVKVELADDLTLWTLIPERSFEFRIDQYPLGKQPELIEIDSDDIKLVQDPRIRYNNFLGYRFFTRLGANRLDDIGRFCKLPDSDTTRLRLSQGTTTDYRRLRYRFGVSEGIRDNPSGAYYPFELNGDIFNAVSLNKGFYTSEEKVIKIYSSTPMKARIYPVVFSDTIEEVSRVEPLPRTDIVTFNGKRFGNLRERVGRYGIASLSTPLRNSLEDSMMIASFKKLPPLKHKDTGLRLKAIQPFWWPLDIDKQQLPIPDYPRCMFNFQAIEKKLEQPVPEFIPYEGLKEEYIS